MQLYFIRHAQSVNNALYDAGRPDEDRHDDPELTETGKKQIQLLASYLAEKSDVRPNSAVDRMNLTGFHLTHLYSSPMIRAIETAFAISGTTGLPVEAWEDVHECGGIYAHDPETGDRIGQRGKHRAYFSQTYPELILPKSGWEDGWWNRPFEIFEDRERRARRFLVNLLERHGGTDDRVAVVSHGGFYNHVMSLILGLPQRNGLWISIYNTSITRVDFEDFSKVLAYTNRISHLPPELVT